KANVHVDTNGTDYDLKTDANGHYTISFPVADGPVTITVTKAGYVTATANNVAIVHDPNTVQDFDLRFDGACIDVQPQGIEDTVALGDMHTITSAFNMTNSGAHDADFEIKEGNGNTAAPQGAGKIMAGAPVKRVKGQFSPQRPANAKQGLDQKTPSNPIPVPNSPPWTAIANYPSAVMDNTCADIDGLTYCVGDAIRQTIDIGASII